TVLPVSAVPVKAGLVKLVMLSVLEVPESVAAVTSGVEGAAGATLSMVKVAVVFCVSTLPEVSVAWARTTYVSSAEKLPMGKLYDHVGDLMSADERVADNKNSLVLLK